MSNDPIKTTRVGAQLTDALRPPLHGPHSPFRRRRFRWLPMTVARPCYGYRLKRALDMLAAVVAMVLLSPLLLLVAVAVWSTSKGSVLFRQRRLGIHEHPFSILKFRTMRVDAIEVGPAFTSSGDPRITPVGKLLRMTSLDELPQLFNVLLGDMSLIGPRPYVGFELDDCTTTQRAQRSSVRPGISGLAQVSGRSSGSQAESIRYDLDYTERCSLALDLRLALRTALAVLLRQGAN